MLSTRPGGHPLMLPRVFHPIHLVLILPGGLYPALAYEKLLGRVSRRVQLKPLWTKSPVGRRTALTPPGFAYPHSWTGGPGSWKGGQSQGTKDPDFSQASPQSPLELGTRRPLTNWTAPAHGTHGTLAPRYSSTASFNDFRSL